MLQLSFAIWGRGRPRASQGGLDFGNGRLLSSNCTFFFFLMVLFIIVQAA